MIAAPTSQAVPVATFSATPTTVHVGDVISVASITPCPPPDGAGDWTAIVNVAQGSNDQVSFEDFLVANDGSWSGTITVPSGVTLGAASLTATCFDAFHDVEGELVYQSNDITVVAPATTTSTSTTTAPSSTSTSSAPTTTVAVAPVSATPSFTG
jgi:hypothetical protein